LRILMVTNTYAPARNGVAAWVSLSVRELRERGHEVDVLTYAHERRTSPIQGVVEVPAWAGLDRDFRVGPVPAGLPSVVADRGYDVVHVHHPVLLGRAGVALGRVRGAKVAFTCHSVYTDYLDEYYWGAGRFLRPVLNQRSAAFADRCDVTFAPSSRTTEWLRQCGALGRIERLDAPADTTRIRCVAREEARTALGLDGRPIAFYVGRIADEKRVAELVAEFARTLAAVPGALLAIGGSGRRAASIARIVQRRGLARSVRMLGPLDADALALWYSAADTATSASRSETGPLTVVEAMACGCPTVALRAPGFVDRVEDGVNGLLVDDRPGALGEALALVLSDPTLRDALSAGARRHATRFTPGAITDRMLAVYADLLGC
jgi:1,2-diacylglycerol 3-alpha-glucosyltransferase